jgi:hypothetical protein
MSSYFDWTEVRCPYCGAPAELSIDTRGDLPEDTVEECPSCCRSLAVHVVIHADNSYEIQVSRLVED